MLKKIAAANMGKGDQPWLKTHFHFSFADYYNPKNINFGVLRVLNDDFVAPHHGFETHPHNDIEILTYVVQGELTHVDSLGHSATIGRGELQYISAGTGVYHSEDNASDDIIRLLQVWIIPDKRGHKPAYGEYRFPWEARENKWLHMVSDKSGTAPVKINQDANLYALSLAAGTEIEATIGPGRQGYLVQIEGTSGISGLKLNHHDALEIVAQNVVIKAEEQSHFLLIEMKA
ncbi:MAG: Quercetin 2,3-dioxygenase [Firmicutes bacterium]|nr:Quercetin 2,3-dioxygenase [candidate division NPL-UPA2 bacterium]